MPILFQDLLHPKSEQQCAATWLDATEISKMIPQANYPATRTTTDQCWQLQTRLICCWVKHLQHIWQQQIQPTVFKFQQHGSILPATLEPQKSQWRQHLSSLASTYLSDVNFGHWIQESYSEKVKHCLCSCRTWVPRVHVRNLKTNQKCCIHVHTWKKHLPLLVT